MLLTIWEYNAQFEKTAFPQSLIFSRNTALPVLKVE